MPYDYLCEFAYYYFFKNLHFIFNKEIIFTSNRVSALLKNFHK
jgi:hypothetical protein